LKIDALFTATGIDTRADAANAEAAGYSGIWTSETKHDPFLAVALAAVETDRIGLGTSLVIAFARNPMSTAVQANDVQLLSNGRLLLGLGSQIKPHITRRFSMPWSHPAPRMREFILAMRAIWDCWNTGSKLDFRGDFYTHTLMTPFFNPGPNPYGPPAVLLAGVGEVMTAVAAEVACTVPSQVEAVTATRSVLPTSPLATTYVEPLSPAMGPHAPPPASQRSH